MGRRLPRSFFWIDQNVIRTGAWLKLSAQARLAYIALAASCDREGVSIWSTSKLMELSACREREAWGATVAELESEQLIESMPEFSPPAIRLRELEMPNRSPVPEGVPRSSAASPQPPAPIIVHTHTTIHLGGKAADVETRITD